LSAKQRFKGISGFSYLSDIMLTRVDPFVVLNEADSLSRDAQAALRTMERYMTNMRIILCSTRYAFIDNHRRHCLIIENSTSKLIAPIKSRCLLVRVGAPQEGEVLYMFSYQLNDD